MMLFELGQNVIDEFMKWKFPGIEIIYGKILNDQN